MFAETKSEITSIFDEIRIAEDTIYALPDKLYWYFKAIDDEYGKYYVDEIYGR